MITLRLSGGLGNQMFEYAFARRLALHLHTDLQLDTNIGFVDDFYERTYALDCFYIDAKLAPDAYIRRVELMRVYAGRKQQIRAWFYRYFFNPNIRLIREKSAEYDQNLLNLKGNNIFLLAGYWQSEKYFKPIEALIRQEFRFKNKVTGKNIDILTNIQNSNAVCLHVRQLMSKAADGSPNEDGMKVISPKNKNYYQEALDFLYSKINPDGLQLFVFSDVPQWAKTNLQLPDNVIFVEGNSDADDMQLMSHCRHFIIPNSSFSWWAAWLSNYPEKIIIAPKQWFNDQRNDSDLVPQDWFRV